ncbi:UNVERIFIED_CONTAM: hypothetical protein NCL1_48271 [Trichonephila clavipes]
MIYVKKRFKNITNFLLQNLPRRVNVVEPQPANNVAETSIVPDWRHLKRQKVSSVSDARCKNSKCYKE